MDIPIPSTGRAPAAARVSARADAGRVGAWAVFLGTAISTVGLSWDVQWHIEVGPDTFFTLSHLTLYTGSALSGIASLVMVLMATSAQRAGRPLPRSVGGTPIRVFGGVFSAPLGYLVSGIGAALFLLYGLMDLEWHSIYGFDAVLNTPSHVALFLAITITMIGCILVFAAASEQRWGKLGIMLAIPVLMVFAPIPTNALTNLPLSFDPTVAGVIFFTTLLLITGAAALRRPGAAIAIAVVLGVIQAFLWWFSPWAAEVYAAGVGLPMRDGLTPQPPQVPSAIPIFLIAAAAVVELLFWRIRTRGRRAKGIFLIAGMAVGLIIAIDLPLQEKLTSPAAHLTGAQIGAGILFLAVIGIPLGALAGFLSGRFTIMLRAIAPTEKDV